MIKHKTREEWLSAAVAQIRSRFDHVFELHFGKDGLTHLDNLRVSTGFPSRGGLSKVIGECWASRAAADEVTHHIFISPRLVDVVRVVETLAHEMVHAADDNASKHKGLFVKAVRDLGLEGKATATFAGDEFREWAELLESQIGEYPHIGLTPMATAKKQTTRMLKLEAPCCGYVARTTKKWIEVGLPSCPCGTQMEEA